MMSYLLKKHANLFYISGSNYKTYRRKMSQQTLQTEYLEFSVLRIIIIVGVTSMFKINIWRLIIGMQLNNAEIRLI